MFKLNDLAASRNVVQLFDAYEFHDDSFHFAPHFWFRCDIY